MSEFSLETPPEVTRPRNGRGPNERVVSGVEFARKHPGQWFVFEAEPFSNTVAGDESRVRSRVIARCNALKAEAKRRGMQIKVSTRKVDGQIKGYTQAVTEEQR